VVGERGKEQSVAQRTSAPQASKRRGRAERRWYDYPHYYELGFRDFTGQEADFIEQVCQRYVPEPVERLLEPGCGSGRLVLEMASRGYEITGLDLNRRQLAYCRQRLKRRGLSAQLLEQDMTEFELPERFGAAFNTINTFRHLLTERAAQKHLETVARHLVPGGVYILGLHVYPPDADLEGSERWRAVRGQTRVSYSLTAMEACRRKRLERLRLSMTVRKPSESFRVTDELVLRLYNATQLQRLIARVPQLRLEGVFDFHYQIDEPQLLDDEINDTVLILKHVPVAGAQM
jgi:SAM-dependent methyltransferase